MDSLSLERAIFQPMQLRAVVAGSAGARFDALLGSSRDRMESEDIGSPRSAERDRPEAPQRDDDIGSAPEPRGVEQDDSRASNPDPRDDQRAWDDLVDKPDGLPQQQPAARSDTAVALANTDRSAMPMPANPANIGAATQLGATAGRVPASQTPAPTPGQSGGLSSPQQAGAVPQGTEPLAPRGSQTTPPPVRLVPSPTPPIAPPRGALGAQAALAAQSTGAGTTETPGAQSAISDKSNIQIQAAATAGAGATSNAEAASGKAAKKITGGANVHAGQKGAAEGQIARGPDTAPAGPPLFRQPGVANVLSTQFAGHAGVRPLGLLSFAAPSIGLSTPLSTDYATPGPRPATSLPFTTEQVAVQIHKAANAGQDRVNIRLYPADLGRVDVKLEWADDGALRAVISAERSETLDLLQRDSRALDRALQEAGLKTDSGSLSFDLRGNAEHRDATAEAGDREPTRRGPENPDDDTTAAEMDVHSRLRAHDGVLDLSV